MREACSASKRIGLWVVVSACLLLAGCAGGPADTAQSPADDRVPPDFAMTFLVDGVADHADPARRSAVYLVEPDRTLRAATGPGCTLDSYPGPTAALSLAQVTEVHRLVRTARLDRSDDGNATSLAPPYYRVIVRAHGVRVRHDVPIADSPAAAELARYLARLSGLR